jgi:hypothetical protein
VAKDKAGQAGSKPGTSNAPKPASTDKGKPGDKSGSKKR